MSDLQALMPEGTQHLIQKIKAEKEDVFRLSTMPTANAENVGRIVQFIGTTSGSYTHGYFYECKENSGSYSWQQTDVQPNGGGSGLPSGGTTGQVLKKKSNTDYDVEWGEGGSGGEGSIIIITDTYSLYEDETITVSKGTYSKSAVIENGSATINGFTEIGTITVSVSDFTKTFNIDKYSKYEVGVGSVGSFYAQWLDSIDESSASYSSLADVLADEEMVRELFTRHASVDFLVSNVGNYPEELETIINNDYCAKWINLRDYALDTLYANQLVASLMDQANKYFYGEWTIVDSTTTPPTWGSKGNVPVMTSNTAPYGIASTLHNTEKAYLAFDGNPSTYVQSNVFQYQSVNPICVRDFICKDTLNRDVTGGTLEGSNDGSTWTTISTLAKNTSYYMYHRLHFSSSATVVATLQLYGRELKISVPTMTSDIAPYGKASASSYANSQFKAFMAFDNDTSTEWQPSSKTNERIIYEFPSPVCIKQVSIKAITSDGTRLKNFKVQAYDRSDWVNLGSYIYPSNAVVDVVDVANTSHYKKYAVFCVDNYSDGNRYFRLQEVQFYGFSYSEYDWDTDNPRHYIYDHGVELEEIETSTFRQNSNMPIVNGTKNPSDLEMQTTVDPSSCAWGTKNTIPFANYSCIVFNIVEARKSASNVSVNLQLSSTKMDFYDTHYVIITPTVPYVSTKQYVDISNENREGYAIIGTPNIRWGSINEWWLE